MKYVLIVDDDPGITGVLTILIQYLGYASRTAYDGQAALDALKEGLPDLIILDLMMPRVDGFEFLSRISKDPLTRSIPVLVCSAHAQADSTRVYPCVKAVFQKGFYAMDDLRIAVVSLIGEAKDDR